MRLTGKERVEVRVFVEGGMRLTGKERDEMRVFVERYRE